MATTLHDLREVTVEGRRFPTVTDLHRWGGVDAVERYGCCPRCGCTKSGDICEPNTCTGPCTDHGCLCHDADVVSLEPLAVLLGVERHWPYVCSEEAGRRHALSAARPHRPISPTPGSSWPRTPVDAETATLALRFFHEHIRYPVLGPSPMLERDYHDGAADACESLVREYRHALSREVAV